MKTRVDDWKAERGGHRGRVGWIYGNGQMSRFFISLSMKFGWEERKIYLSKCSQPTVNAQTEAFYVYGTVIN